MTDRIGSLLGICRKGGQVSSGEFAAEEAVKKRKAKLLILSEDASLNTKKKFRNMCTFYKVPVMIYGSKENLGRWIGCLERAVVTVNNEQLAEKIRLIFRQKTDTDT